MSRFVRDASVRKLAKENGKRVAKDFLLWLDGKPLLDVPLLERRRLLDSVIAETDLVRRGTFVRPPIDRWVGSWRSMGFPGISFKAANGRYAPGAAALDWASIAMPRH